MKDVRGEFTGTNCFVDANIGARWAGRRLRVRRPAEEQDAKKHLSAFHRAESIREGGTVREIRFPGESR